MSISYSRIPIRMSHCSYLSCLFRFLWSVTCSQSFHVFHDLDSFEEYSVQFSSLTLSGPNPCDPMDCSPTTLPVHHQLLELTQTCPLSRWCHPTISSSVIPFSSYLQSFLSSGSFHMSQIFASDGQSIGILASASVLPMNIQDWIPLGWTGWISLQSKWLSSVFFNTTVQKHQFFCAQLSSWSNSHIHTWLLEKP